VAKQKNVVPSWSAHVPFVPTGAHPLEVRPDHATGPDHRARECACAGTGDAVPGPRGRPRTDDLVRGRRDAWRDEDKQYR